MNKSEYKVCLRCVMDTTDPEIQFDENGYCNHCNEYFNKYKVYINRITHSEHFDAIITKIKKAGRKNAYDCVVGVSGGLDSSYVLYLTKQLGLRPLAVHVDNGWDSEKALHNIKALCDKLEVDYDCYVLDWEEFKDIQAAVLRSGIVEVEIPTDVAISGAVHHIAAKNKVKYIISGGNLLTEGIMPKKWFYNPKDKVLLKAIHRRYGKKRIKHLPFFGYVEELYYKFIKGIRIFYILDYVPFNPAQVQAQMENEFNWQKHTGKHHESIFTYFVQAYLQPLKFNLDYRKLLFSLNICNGEMTRESALAELAKPAYNPLTIELQKEYVMKKLDIMPEEFEAIISSHPNSYKNFPNSERLYSFMEKMYKRLFPNGRL